MYEDGRPGTPANPASVAQRQQIGRCDNTGQTTTATHLHFALEYGGPERTKGSNRAYGCNPNRGTTRGQALSPGPIPAHEIHPVWEHR